MKKPLIIIIIVIVVIGAGAAVYFATQSKDTNTNVPTNSASQTNTSAATNAESADRYIGDDFSIVPPEDWLWANIPGTLIAFQNSEETHPEGSAAAKINFRTYIAVSFDNAPGKTLDEIATTVQEQTLSVIPSTAFQSVTDGTIDGQPAKFLEADLTQQDVNYKIMIAIVLKGDKYFTISSNTTTDKWTEYKDLLYNTARSFKFKYDDTTNTNTSESGNAAPYIIVSDPQSNTKYFELELINGQFNYDRIDVKIGDSFKITLTENGQAIDFGFEEHDAYSTDGLFSSTVTDPSTGTVIMTCKDRDCGQLEFVINE